MEKKFKVNEVAKLFNISRQTLVYYDNINLFKPVKIDEETSYRYYSEEQFFTLHFILTLKKAGFSLKEIKGYINTNSIEEGLEYLQEREREIAERLKALKETQKIIRFKIKETQEVLKGETTPKIIKTTLGRAVFFDIDLKEIHHEIDNKPHKLSNFKKYHEKIDEILEIKKHAKIKDDKIINIMDRNDTAFTGVKKAGFFIKEDISDILEDIYMSRQTYAAVSHRGPWNDIEESYKSLVSFIEESNYEINGDFIEVFNNINVYLGSGEGGKIDIYIPIRRVLKKH